MTQQLAYAIITDKSLEKSATGYIIAELLRGVGVSPLELVAARMYAPSRKLIKEYSTTMDNKLFADYLINEYVKNNDGRTRPAPKRALFLLFKGEDAIRKVRGTVGHATKRIDGTIRNLFENYPLHNKRGKVISFDPAVLIMPDEKQAREKLEIWVKYAKSDGGLLDDRINWKRLIYKWEDYNFEALKSREGIENVTKEKLLANIETTLTLIKPREDITNSPHVGHIISMFAGTGLKLIGCKAFKVSIDQAMRFYAPVKERISKEGFYELIEYMTGKDPKKVLDPDARLAPGEAISLALVYQGPFAISRIRNKLGATDPTKAAPGTIRSVYGLSIMENGAHASDSKASAERELGIINVKRTTLKEYVNNFYEMHR